MLLKINGPNSYFWQWDSGRQLIVGDNACGEVHFCNGTTETALVCGVFEQDGQRLVNVPNIFLQTDRPITAYLYLHGADGCLTRHRQDFRVLTRIRPDDYAYVETEIKHWYALELLVKALEQTDEHLEQLIESQAQDIQALEQSGAALAQGIQALEQSGESLARDVRALEQSAESLAKTDESLAQGIAAQAQSIQTLIQSIQALEQSNESLAQRVKTLEAKAVTVTDDGAGHVIIA